MKTFLFVGHHQMLPFHATAFLEFTSQQIKRFATFIEPKGLTLCSKIAHHWTSF